MCESCFWYFYCYYCRRRRYLLLLLLLLPLLLLLHLPGRPRPGRHLLKALVLLNLRLHLLAADL